MHDDKIVTRKSIKLTYDLLRSMEPFASWRLPTKIETRVVNDASMYGCFDDPDVITISTAKVWDVKQLVETVGHEMIHLYQHRLKRLNEDHPHDEFFNSCAREVTIKLGFDKENF